MDRQRGGRTDGQMDGWTDGQTFSLRCEGASKRKMKISGKILRKFALKHERVSAVKHRQNRRFSGISAAKVAVAAAVAAMVAAAAAAVWAT